MTNNYWNTIMLANIARNQQNAAVMSKIESYKTKLSDIDLEIAKNTDLGLPIDNLLKLYNKINREFMDYLDELEAKRKRNKIISIVVGIMSIIAVIWFCSYLTSI